MCVGYVNGGVWGGVGCLCVCVCVCVCVYVDIFFLITQPNCKSRLRPMIFTFCSGKSESPLEEYNIDRNGVSMGDSFRCEEQESLFEQGGLLQDFDRADYRVLECYSQNNLLLLNQKTGKLLVAVDVKCYDRYPYAGRASKENRETGIKWKQAVYLNPVPSQLDFKALKEEYRERGMELVEKSTEKKIQDAISKAGDMPDGSLGEAIDQAMEVYRKSRMDGSGEIQQVTRHPTLNGRGR